MKFHFLSNVLGCVFFLFSSYLSTEATSMIDIQYKNLYHSWVTVFDISHMKRLLTRQIHIKESSLYWCSLVDLPTIEYIITNTKPTIWLRWFLSCRDSHWKMIVNKSVWTNLTILRNWTFDNYTKNPIAYNTDFDPIKHTNITIYREYLKHSYAGMIQYYSYSAGIFMIIRDSSGVVIDSENVWHYQYTGDKNELSRVRDILQDKWYHP